ncbi:UNVERIFIED_CONTAM: hypothetical protein GTU68_010881 [Idotea baltica]|nr:hypothetical protein [Idotea baltica]
MFRGFKFNIQNNWSFRSCTKSCLMSTCYSEKGSVYVHWPYCKRRCSYCNFVKYIPRDNTAWTFPDTTLEDAMVTELEFSLKNSPIKTITSVFFGGGTPSLARPQLVEKVLSTIENCCLLASNAEVSLEANPTSMEAQKLSDFKHSGVNRLSLGVQSLHDDILQLLNREHSAIEALDCIEKAKQIFLHKLSIDLMFGLPHQTIQMWEKDLELILESCDDHVSLYQLTLERGTRLFKQVKAGELSVCSREEEVDMYELAVSFLAGKGFRRYEVSNFARNLEAESGHNKAVWQGGQYVGIGPGAHSRVVRLDCEKGECLPDGAREARANATDPQSWLREVSLKGTGARRVTRQTRLDMQMEYLATGLRTAEGVTQLRWRDFCAFPLGEVFGGAVLDPEVLVLEKDRFRATPKGINVLDAFLPNLINWVQEYDRS